MDSSCSVEFSRNSAAQRIRSDLRSAAEHRAFRVCFHERLGCASVLHSSTLLATCSVSSSLVRPSSEKPFEGRLAFYVESDRISEIELNELRDTLDKVYKHSAIDVESLCILNGELVRRVFPS